MPLTSYSLHMGLADQSSTISAFMFLAHRMEQTECFILAISHSAQSNQRTINSSTGRSHMHTPTQIGSDAFSKFLTDIALF